VRGVNPELFISPAFIVILFAAVALLTAAVLWLMRDGPSARRAGMIDLTGVKPKGMSWDWPTAPNTVDDVTRRTVAKQSSNVAEEPERRPSFGV
jgi:hypothetical protein